MSITDLILRENYVEAKSIITEHMNQLALSILDEVKVHYAKSLFTEEIDAKFKGKTDMDFVKDAKAEAGADDEEDDVPEPDNDESEDDEAPEDDEPEDDDDDNNKTVKSKSGNVTVNIKEARKSKADPFYQKMSDRDYEGAVKMHLAMGMGPEYKGVTFDDNDRAKMKKLRDAGLHPKHMLKEGVVPVANGKPSTDQPGGGAAENPTWKGKQKALMAMKKALNKTATTAVVSESEDIQELKKSTLGSYIKKAANDVAYNSYEQGKKYHRNNPGDRNDSFHKGDKAFKRQKGIFKATQKLVDGKHDKD